MSEAEQKTTVFVVDDEEIIRDMATAMLTDRGFEVVAAENGLEAVEKFGRKSEEIDVVLLDMVMPGLSGQELFSELKKIKPEVKVILSSGYAAEDIAGELMENEGADFIEKPYSLAELVEKINKALGK